MRQKKIRRIPIIDQDDHIVGLFSTTSLVASAAAAPETSRGSGPKTWQ